MKSYEQIDQSIRLRSGLPTNLRLARFILTGLRNPCGSGNDRCYHGANLVLVIDDEVRDLDLRVGDPFQVRDQNWRLDTTMELAGYESAAMISRTAG